MTTEVTSSPYQTREEYLKQEGFDHIKFGNENLHIFFKDLYKEVPLKGSSSNDRLLFWDENKKNIWNVIGNNKSNNIKTVLLQVIIRKLTIDNKEEQRSPTRRPPPKETRIESFHSKDGSCFVVASKESAPFGKKVITTINRVLDWNRESVFGNTSWPIYLSNTIKRLIESKKNVVLESDTICRTIETSLEGWQTPDKPRTYCSIEFGEISRNKIISTLINILGAKKYGHHGKARKLVFDLDKLDRIDHDLPTTSNKMQVNRYLANTSLRRKQEQLPVPMLSCYSIVPVSMLPTSITPYTSHSYHVPFFISTLQTMSHNVPSNNVPLNKTDVGDALTSDIGLDQRRAKVKKLIEKGYSQRQVARLVRKSQRTIIRDLRNVKGDALTSDITSDGTLWDASCKVDIKKGTLPIATTSEGGISGNGEGEECCQTRLFLPLSAFSYCCPYSYRPFFIASLQRTSHNVPLLASPSLNLEQQPPSIETDSNKQCIDDGINNHPIPVDTTTQLSLVDKNGPSKVNNPQVNDMKSVDKQCLFWEAFYKFESNGVCYLGSILDVLEKAGISIEDALQMVIELKEQGCIMYNDSNMELVLL